jgi:hypothetical protein
MSAEQPRERAEDLEQATDAQFTTEGQASDVPAWEQVDIGRYMPRRIKGSCKGRALG